MFSMLVSFQRRFLPEIYSKHLAIASSSGENVHRFCGLRRENSKIAPHRWRPLNNN